MRYYTFTFQRMTFNLGETISLRQIIQNQVVCLPFPNELSFAFAFPYIF